MSLSINYIYENEIFFSFLICKDRTYLNLCHNLKLSNDALIYNPKYSSLIIIHTKKTITYENNCFIRNKKQIIILQTCTSLCDDPFKAKANIL